MLQVSDFKKNETQFLIFMIAGVYVLCKSNI